MEVEFLDLMVASILIICEISILFSVVTEPIYIPINSAKPMTVWITTNHGKFWKRWEYQTTWPASWEISMQVKKEQLEPDMEQQNGSKLGKEYITLLI